MAKPIKYTGKPTAGYAIRLTMGMVLLSWLGLQMLFMGAAFYVKKDLEGMGVMLVIGVVLIGYSLNLRGRLKQRDALPTREQAILFYTAFAILLVPVTGWMRFWLYRRFFIVGALAWVPSVIVSVAYFGLAMMVVLGEADNYPHSPREAISRRVLKVLRAPLEWFKDKDR